MTDALTGGVIVLYSEFTSKYYINRHNAAFEERLAQSTVGLVLHLIRPCGGGIHNQTVRQAVENCTIYLNPHVGGNGYNTRVCD